MADSMHWGCMEIDFSESVGDTNLKIVAQIGVVTSRRVDKGASPLAAFNGLSRDQLKVKSCSRTGPIKTCEPIRTRRVPTSN